MKIRLISLTFLSLFFALTSLSGQNSKAGKEYDPIDAASQQAVQISEQLGLEYWQEFYVDSLLKVEYVRYYEEYQKLVKEKVSGIEIYQRLQDESMERIDNFYQSVFTDEQWKKYLKMGAGKAQKDRQKRLNK